MKQYNALANVYDRFQGNINFSSWAKFLQDIYEKYAGEACLENPGMGARSLAVDLGCGSGKLAIQLADMGWHVVAVDAADEMLEVAAYHAQEHFGEKEMPIYFFQEDITDLDLPMTVNLAYTSLDTINHIEASALEGMFKQLKKTMKPGAVLCFDLLQWSYMEKAFHEEVYYDVTDEYAVLWQNNLSMEKQENLASISVFVLQDNGFYTREDIEIVEYYHNPAAIMSILEDIGFRVEEIQLAEEYYTDLQGQNRHFIVAVKD